MGKRTKQTVKGRARAHRIQVMKLRRRKSRMRGAARRQKNRSKRKSGGKK